LFFEGAFAAEKTLLFLLCFLAGHFGMTDRPNRRKYLGIFDDRTRNSLSDVIATDLESNITLL
jgi:hypothetical protein